MGSHGWLCDLEVDDALHSVAWLVEWVLRLQLNFAFLELGSWVREEHFRHNRNRDCKLLCLGKEPGSLFVRNFLLLFKKVLHKATGKGQSQADG